MDVLNGRTHVFCCEERVLDALRQLPPDSFSARVGCRFIEDIDDFARLNPCSFFNISFRLKGGKGGFGTLLRSFRINKSSNQYMCRDLNGRRLGDVKDEEKLKKWIEKAAEREKAKEEKKKAKYEKLKAGVNGDFKHDFNDPEYIKRREEILDKTEDAFDAGFEHLRKKRKKGTEATSKEEEGKEVEEESSSEDEDTPGTSNAMRLKMKRRKTESHEEKRATDSPPQTETPPDAQIKNKKELPPVKEPIAVPEKKEEVVAIPVKETPPAQEAPALPSLPVSYSDVNLDEMKSVAELEVLGLPHLKDALEKRGLKCGGSLSERASRLFSIKGLAPHQYPKNILAAPPKQKKNK